MKALPDLPKDTMFNPYESEPPSDWMNRGPGTRETGIDVHNLLKFDEQCTLFGGVSVSSSFCGHVAFSQLCAIRYLKMIDVAVLSPRTFGTHR